jgi:ribosomal-protein-alanine N-acetyltransferase
LNANLVTLEVRASNQTAQSLYKKYGFRVIGRRPRYYSSDGEDAIIMSTDNIGSLPFQASLQDLKKAYAQRYREILTKIR